MSGKYGLIIGNTEYIDSGLAQLISPCKDAEDFARVLKDKDLCAFDEVKILLNDLSSLVIESIDEFFDQRKPDDLLVLYFSGHGVRDEMGSLYLAVKNTIHSRLRSTAIRADYIREAMDQSRSKRQILILDCCNSGAFPQGTKAELGGPMGMTRALQGYGRFVLTASDATQFAWEGDKVIGQTQNSLFTHFLVKGLEGEADNNGDGKITVDELYDYAFDEISRVTPKQTPTKSASKQEGEIVLRQIKRIEDIKPISLPEEMIEAIDDSRTFVREGAVQQLKKLLKGKNLGLARSAREILERIEREDDSRRVSQAATQVLEPIRQAEQAAAQRAEEERLVAEKEEVKRAKAEHLGHEKAEAEKKIQEAQRQAQQSVEIEHLEREKAEVEQSAKEEKARMTSDTKPDSPRSYTLIWVVLGIIGLCVSCSGLWWVYNQVIGAPTEPPPFSTRTPNLLFNTATNQPPSSTRTPEFPLDTATDPPSLATPGEPFRFGPESGTLIHDNDDNSIETYGTEVDVGDFVAQATFRNPYATATGSWNYGFIFRHTGFDDQYRLIFTSMGEWSLRNYTGTSDGVIIQSGQLSNWNTDENGSNTIWLFSQGNHGILYINGRFIADLDLSARSNSGDVKVGTGFYTDTEIDGYSTNYENFQVHAISLIFGAESGEITHEVADGLIETFSPAVNVSDFIASAAFLNPYSSTTGSWNYGFTFRDAGRNEQYRLIVTSAGEWKLWNHTGTADGVIIDEGQLSNLDLSENGSNIVWLFCQDNHGIFYANGDFIVDLDLSARSNSGDVALGTGFYVDDEIEGYSTEYEEFTIWEIP